MLIDGNISFILITCHNSCMVFTNDNSHRVSQRMNLYFVVFFFFIHNSCLLPLWSHAISGSLVIYITYDQNLVTWTNFKTFFLFPQWVH